MAKAEEKSKKQKTESKKTTEEVKAEENTVEAETQKEKTTAKAGKRSAKAIKETEEKQAKASRKATQSAEAQSEVGKPKAQQKPPRSRLERRSKGYRKASELIEKDKVYTLAEAVDLATKTSPVKFDSTLELHVNLDVDPRQADQNVRDTVVLPAGTGKTSVVAVFAEADDAANAKKAGADIAGIEEITKNLDKGVINFDTLIASPKVMAQLGKYARVLGPKGLMPNPKSGTVTNDIAKAVKEAKAGKVEYRVDSTGIVHLGVGKVSFGKDKLLENTKAVLASIRSNKPASVKGTYVKSVHVTTTMGPGINVSPSEL